MLLALNWLSVLVFQPVAQPRVTVPFSPYFLNQLEAGQVKSISSKGDTIQGTFTAKLSYPASVQDGDADDPVLDPGAELLEQHRADARCLQHKGVQVNAKSTTTGTSLLAEILLGFGPTLLLVGLFVLLARRAARGRRRGARRARATSGARRRGGSTPRRSGSRSTTSPGSTRPRPS